MRIFHLHADQFAELQTLPEQLPATGWLWIGASRREVELQIGTLQSTLARWTGGQLFEPHVSDLLNPHLPSHYDYTSWYDVLVFRRLAAGGVEGAASTQRRALASIDTS